MSGVRLKYGFNFFDVQTNTLVPLGRKPTPLVSLNTTANTDKDDNILSFTTSIELEGTIVGSGISSCLSAYSGIKAYFMDPAKQGKTFEIWCDSGVLSSYSGTSFKSITAPTSENNWVVTIPYTVVLESVAPASGDSLIESFEDSWTIEPLDEVFFFDYNRDSPVLNYNSSNVNTTNPPSQSDLSAASRNITIKNFLQYRITHRLSAIGRSIDRTNTNNPSSGGPANTNNLKSPAYVEAARWVMSRASGAYGPSVTNPTGIRVNNDSNGLNLYNHIRSIESNVSAGSYGITDTWLALGTGVKFVEDFTWEISTDDKLVKTVTLQGTIKGLESNSSPGSQSSSSGYVVFPSGAMTGYIPPNFKNSFPAQTRNNNRFDSAISGYQSGVKPFLYDRASLALSSVDKPTVSSSSSSTQPIMWIGPPKWSPLNVTPVSYTETLNPVAGTVSYSVVYTNKVGSWLSGVLSSTMNVVDTNPADQIAETFVLGRPLGPILEKVGTTKSERKLNIEVNYPVPTGYKQSHPNSPECIIFAGRGSTPARSEYTQLKELVDSFRPINPVAFATLVPTSPYPVANQGQVFKTADSTSWNPFEGRFTWDVTWVYNTGICT